MSDRMDDLDAITAVVQMYVDGAAKADVGRLKEVFHESARMFGNEGDESEDMPISEFFEEVATTPAPGPGFRSRIMSIDVVEDAAVAVLAEDDYLGVDYVNFFSLIKIDGTWKIVTKLFAVTGQTPTDEA
jgi:Putative lumazine-binding